MRFRLVDIRCSSKIVQFILSNEGTFQLLVETSNKDAYIFQPYKLYDIHVSHEIPQHELNSHLVRENKKDKNIFTTRSHYKKNETIGSYTESVKHIGYFLKSFVL